MTNWLGVTHPQAIVLHACRRLYQRHGVAISRKELSRYSAMCQDGRAPPLAQARKGGTIHCIAIGGRDVYAVFRDGAIVTFLPGVPFEVRLAQWQARALA